MLTNMGLVLAKEKLDKSKLFFGKTDAHENHLLLE